MTPDQILVGPGDADWPTIDRAIAVATYYESVQARKLLEAAQPEPAGALLTIEDAAKLLRLTPRQLRKRIDRGTIKAVRVGRSLRLRRRDLGL
jgi:excisionase family DNA binding protein